MINKYKEAQSLDFAPLYVTHQPIHFPNSN